MATNQVQKVNWWHERLADWMIANPNKNIKDAAKEFDVTVQALYLIKNSDAFAIYWSTRSGDFSEALKNRAIDHTTAVMEKTAAVTDQALDALSARLESQAEVLPIGQLIDISNMGLKALGYKASKNAPAGAGVVINNFAVNPEALERARSRMKQQYGTEAAEPRKLEVVDVTSE